MHLTPLDVQQKQFVTRLRGYDAIEVRQFLELCADEMEDLVRETIDLKEEMQSRDALLAETRDREHALQDALVSAQRLAAEMKEQARKEAELIVGEAEMTAEKIVRDAHARRATLLSELGELRSLRVSFESELRAMTESHVRLLENFAQAERNRSMDDRVALLQEKKG